MHLFYMIVKGSCSNLYFWKKKYTNKRYNCISMAKDGGANFYVPVGPKPIQ